MSQDLRDLSVSLDCYMHYTPVSCNFHFVEFLLVQSVCDKRTKRVKLANSSTGVLSTVLRVLYILCYPLLRVPLCVLQYLVQLYSSTSKTDPDLDVVLYVYMYMVLYSRVVVHCSMTWGVYLVKIWKYCTRYSSTITDEKMVDSRSWR